MPPVLEFADLDLNPVATQTTSAVSNNILPFSIFAVSLRARPPVPAGLLGQLLAVSSLAWAHFLFWFVVLRAISAPKSCYLL